MLDTVVHQLLAPAPAQKYYYRHPPRRQGRPGEGFINKRKRKAAAPAPARMEVDFDAPAAPAYAAEATPHFTPTNLQEKGVDEADIIKTDGKYVYSVHGQELVIAKTWPVDKAAVASRLTFKTLVPQQVYLHGSELVVQGMTTEPQVGWEQARTRVVIVDIRNRERPEIKRLIDVDGTVVSSRIVRDDLVLVQASAIPIPPALSQAASKAFAAVQQPQTATLRPWEAQARTAAMLRTALANELTTADVERALPRVRNGFVTKQLACADLHMPADTIQTQITTLAKISLVDAETEMVSAVVAGAQVYASPTALYVTAPQALGTQVHQFSLGDDTTPPAYVASGRVEGTLLNQFSMSEWRGDLRIATTDANMTGNNLFVMRPFGKTLHVIGSLRGLGKGERIYAGRLVGEQGYVVTFRQTDPLYTLDLADPTKPEVAGELKVNGFSSYIHPIGNGLLLTIGQDADARGVQRGVHLQVFDVKDPTKPTRRFHHELGAGSYSTAQSDHKAFLWDPKTKTFAVPLAQVIGKTYFQGLAVFTLDKQAGFTSRGRLDHARLAKDSSPIVRSLVIDDYLVSMSELGLEIHALADLGFASAIAWAR